MSNKIVVSNIRFPQDEWIQLKIAANSVNMSTNEYLRYLSKAETIKNMTGIKEVSSKPRGYEAMEKFLHRNITGKSMEISKDDQAIYDPD